MALRVKRRLGYGRFRSLVGLAILVLQCAVVGYVDADIRQLRTVLRWTCDTRREDQTLEVHPRDPDSSSKSQHLFGFCTPIRGGQVDEEDSPTEDVGTFESDDPATYVLKASEKKAVIDYSKSPFTFTLFQDEDGSRDDPDGIPLVFGAIRCAQRCPRGSRASVRTQGIPCQTTFKALWNGPRCNI